MTEEEIDAYQAGLVRLTGALVAAAAAGNYRQAGRVFTRLLEAQAKHGQLPDQAGMDAILAELNKVPSRVLGLRPVDG